MINPGCKKRLFCSLAPLIFFTSTCSASGHFYMGASVAASFANIGNSSPQVAYLSGATITDAYPLTKNNPSTAIFSVNGGFEFTGEQWKPAIAFGLGIYNDLVDYNYPGQVFETAEGDARSYLYNYNFDIGSTRLMAEMQLSWMIATLSPFINVGVGPAWNRMNDYHEFMTTLPGYPPLPPFQTRINDTIAYQAGFGVSTAFNLVNAKTDVLKERLSVGYRYVNLGNTSFGTRGVIYPFALNTGLLSTNEIYLSYTHLF